jgi:hypothetical protein
MNRDRSPKLFCLCQIDFEIVYVICQDNLKHYLDLVAVIKMQHDGLSHLSKHSLPFSNQYFCPISANKW